MRAIQNPLSRSGRSPLPMHLKHGLRIRLAGQSAPLRKPRPSRLVDFVSEPSHSFFNINTPKDFERAGRLWALSARPKILGIAGWKNSGKTGLTVRLVANLIARGYKVSTIKHAHHDFDIDKVGADSFRHRQAGAHEVTIVSGTRYAIMHELRGAA